MIRVSNKPKNIIIRQLTKIVPTSKANVVIKLRVSDRGSISRPKAGCDICPSSVRRLVKYGACYFTL